MKGFFTNKKIRKRTAVESAPCDTCGLYAGCQSPQMPVSGNGRKKILIIAEAPGKQEDEENTQLIGDAGQLKERKLRDLANIDLHEDCWKINAVNCRPPKNRKPTAKEIECCRHFIVEKTIKELRPKYIILAGGAAVESMYKPLFSDCSIGRWRGLLINDTRYGAWVMPVLHPSYYLRNKTDKNTTSVYDRDLRKVGANIKRKKKRPVGIDLASCVTIGADYKDVIRALNKLLAPDPKKIFIDYESTSLKPWGAEQRIWSISFSYTPNDAFSFPLDYPHWTGKQRDVIFKKWRQVLLAKHIQKIAHNVKFEDVWSRVIFKIKRVANWRWCTMLTAHNIDVRKGNAGLKFLLFIKYGVVPYDDDVKKYIAPRGNSTINTLDKVPLPKLLKYGGMDTAGGMLLYEEQIRTVRGEFYNANKLTFEGGLALATAQINGIPLDELYFVERRQDLTEKIDAVENLLLNGKVAKAFKKKTGKQLQIKNKDFSASDLRKVFFDILKVKPTKLTGKSGQAAIDKEVISEIDNPFAQQILERRKLVKMRDTYLASLMRELSPDGRIHPFFDLHTTRTLRSSSSMPNFQNIPNREEEDRALIRKGIYPSPGRKIAAVDYGSIEVRILACCTKDPVLMAYIFDETTDMHRDEAKKIFVVDEDRIDAKRLKILRSWIKNQWVFPIFYGSYFVTCAKAIWDLCFHLEVAEGVTVKDHLIDIGLINRDPRKKFKKDFYGRKITVTRQYADWENHIKDIEDDFWDKYHVSREWQNEQTAFYQRHGYVKLLTGHRRYEILNRNKIYNTPVQGTAFQCLLWSYKELNRRAEYKWRTDLFGQIHDEILFDLDPNEERKVMAITEKVMCHKIREHFDWIIVPLVIEPEVTPVDAAWYYKKAIHTPEVYIPKESIPRGYTAFD